MLTAISLDRSTSMQNFLESTKILSQIHKGVSTLKEYLYPSVLQKQAIPLLKKSKFRKVLLEYSPMSGSKLTVLVSLLDWQTRQAAKGEKSQCCVILCSSQARCHELGEVMMGLTAFMKDYVTIECGKEKLIKGLKGNNNWFIFTTPDQVKNPTKITTLVVDKIEIHTALDFTEDLLKLTQSCNPEKLIITSATK